MSKPLSLASILLFTTAFVSPSLAFAQATDAAAEQAPAEAASPDDTEIENDAAVAADAEQPAEEEVDVSLGGDAPQEIVVTGRFQPNVIRSTPQVVSVLSSAEIARTGEGDIAGALERVTGLSVAQGGFVYVRGLGDRYSLALLNGSPLPSPEPLKRVIPLDIFPTNVIASALVQKSYSPNFTGEFGGGVVNLTTKAVPKERFLEVSGSVSGDTESTFQLGYTYYGSGSDWTGFDDGTRDVPPGLAAAFASGNPILVGADFTLQDIQALATSLQNANTTLLQTNRNIPVNWSFGITGGDAWDIGDGRLGVIASANISNKWVTRQTLQQTAQTVDLSGLPASSTNRVITDNRIIVSGLLGVGYEFGENKLRWTNLYIRDSLKQARLGLGVDNAQQFGRDILTQDTAWYERQLINTQLVGEFKIQDFDIDVRGAYANSQREAPYERSFTYIRTNLDTSVDPVGDRFVNDLGGSRQGDATIAFSDLNEDLFSASADASYQLTPEITATVGYAFSDTQRQSTRRAFQYRASNLPITVQQLRPDFLLSDFTIQTYGIFLLETSAQDGTAAFDASLRTHAGYLQLSIKPIEDVTVNAGVRYETAKQIVSPVDIFNSGSDLIAATNLNNDYWLPAITVTWEFLPDMQLRASGSRTIARPQFRELVSQIYQDTDSNRLFRGNPSLQDSTLTNAEARYEWYFARDQRLAAAVFYKKIDNPIENFTSNSDNLVNTSYANAPSATLYGLEIETQKYFDVANWFDGDFWSTRRLVVIGNYTYTKSDIKVGPSDTTVVNGQVSAASNFFRDGSPLTGQSDHLVNIQLGLEDTESLSQQTFLFSYTSPRVTSRGPSLQPDIVERPGIHLDFVARQAVDMFGLNTEVKFEARNITGQRYTESQRVGGNEIFYNRYDVGTSFSIGAAVKF